MAPAPAPDAIAVSVCWRCFFQVAQYDVSRRDEYAAYARGVQDRSSIGRAAAFAHTDGNEFEGGDSTKSTSNTCTKAGGSSCGSGGDLHRIASNNSGANANPFMNPNGRGSRGICGGGGGDYGEGGVRGGSAGGGFAVCARGGSIGDAEGSAQRSEVAAVAEGSGVSFLQSLPMPYANLRERTFDMTKRGELTSANVWYASRRRDAAAVAGAAAVGGGAVSAKGGQLLSVLSPCSFSCSDDKVTAVALDSDPASVDAEGVVVVEKDIVGAAAATPAAAGGSGEASAVATVVEAAGAVGMVVSEAGRDREGVEMRLTEAIPGGLLED